MLCFFFFYYFSNVIELELNDNNNNNFKVAEGAHGVLRNDLIVPDKIRIILCISLY